jgi:hypothetical protein
MDVSFDDASTSQCVDDSSLSENELDSKVDEEPSPSTREFKTGDCDFVANDDLSEDEFLIDLFTSDVEQEETTLNPVCISQHQNPNLHSLEQFESVFANSDCKSKLYFYQEYVHKNTHGQALGGIRGVAWRAINQINSASYDCLLSNDDAMLLFRMMDHALNNEGEHQHTFFTIVSEVISRAHRPRNTLETFAQCLNTEQKEMLINLVGSLDEQQREMFDNTIYTGSETSQVRVPSNQCEADTLLLKRKWSIFQNIPIEHVRIIDGHAVVSLEGLLDHIVAHGIPILWKQTSDGVCNDDGINGCPAAQKIFESFLSETNEPEHTAFGYFLLWSDGFCRVYVKQRKNSAWMLTVTLLDPHKKDGISTSQFHTYCIALGNSSDDHTSVINFFAEELERVKEKKLRFCGVRNEFIETSFRLLAYLSDRQERDSVVQTLNMGTYGQRFRYAAAIDPNALPFCNNCFAEFCSSLHHLPYPAFPPDRAVCQHCCRWDFTSSSPASKTIPTPKNYPTIQSTTSPPAPANRTVSETCIIGRELEFEWMKQGAHFAFHNATTSEYVPQSRPRRKVRWSKVAVSDYLRTMSISGKAHADLWRSVSAKRRNPQSETLPYIPQLWEHPTVLKIFQFLDSPMHIIFHGTVTDAMELYNLFLNKLQLQPSFERFANKYLSAIEALRLEWCKVRQLPKAQWLAENILGLSRIMPCIYGTFLSLTAVQDQYRKQKLALQQMLNALYVLVSAIMSPRCTYSDSTKIDSYIKMYLSCIQRAARCIIGIPGGDVWWAEKGNMSSLLNLPGVVEEFGPLRWYWEGICERSIQFVKPSLIKNLRRTPTYFQAKLGLLQRLKWIEWLKVVGSAAGDNNAEESARPYKGYYRYPSYESIQQLFEEGCPLCGFTLKVGQANAIWIAYGRKQKVVEIVPIVVGNQTRTIICGITYSCCSLIQHSLTEQRDDVGKLISTYCLLFPCATEPFNSEYAVIHSDWDVIKRDLLKGEPSLSTQLFDQF